MQVYLIRHAEPDVPGGLCYGQFDVPVKKTAIKETINRIRAVIPVGAGPVYSSPLQRCALLARKLSKDVCFDERLMELNFGDWENTFWNRLNGGAFNRWMDDFVNIAPPNGESYMQLYKRAENFIGDLLKQKHEMALVVTHAGFMRSCISFVLGLPLANSFRIQMAYGAVVLLRIEENPSLNQLKSIQ